MKYAVILAGGWGERLWPMSRRERPKQLLELVGEGSLVAQTLARVAPLVSVEDSLVLTGAALRDRMIEELEPIPPARIVGEPVGRNTAPAIALAARVLAAEDPDALFVVLPADHVIRDTDAFRRALAVAFEAADSERALVTLGIRPTRPETEYGYIKAGAPGAADGVFEVESFVEKPDRETAGRYLLDGGYHWNSGIFIWRADVFLAEVERHLPEVAAALEAVEGEPGTVRFEAGIERFYGEAPAVSVDYGVMEKADHVVVVPCEIGWDDVGAWPALSRIWPTDEAGNVVEGQAIVLDSEGTVVYSEEGLVAVVGLSDVVVARTAGATLVCPKDRARDVRAVVEELKRKGLTEGG
jgi:mannose-1-phosphate guanylyltransferase